MLSFDNFIKLYTGIPCDFDNAYKTQCMDLLHFYKYLCLGITDKTTLSAPTAYKSWLLNYPQYFQKINNIVGDLTNFPVRGDIIYWGTKVGSAGHVAIVNKADGMYIQSFDANFPVGTLPHLVNHSYFGVVGWLHPINIPGDEDLVIALKHISNLIDAVKQIDSIAQGALK